MLQRKLRPPVVPDAGNAAVVHLHWRLHREGMGIEHHHRRSLRLRFPQHPVLFSSGTVPHALGGIHVPGQLLQGKARRLVALGPGRVEVPAGLVHGLPDTAARQHVVKLVEEQPLPAPAQSFVLRGRPGENGGKYVVLLRRNQPVFRHAVKPLHAAVGGIAADGVALQVSSHCLQLSFFLPELLEIPVRRGKHHIRVLCAKPLQLQHAVPGRAAAVVAHAVKAHKGRVQLLQPLADLQHLGLLIVHARVFRVLLRPEVVVSIAEHQPQGGDFAAVGRFPDKQRGQLGVFLGAGPLKDVALYARPGKQLGQHAVVAKGIHVVAHLGNDPELFQEIPLRIQQVPGKSFSRGHVAVRLDPHAPRDGPAPLLYPGADLFKQGGLVFFHPLIIGRAGRGKNVVVRFFHSVQSRLKGGLDLRVALRPLPQPDRVDVGVAQQMNPFWLFHDTSPLRCTLSTMMERAAISPTSSPNSLASTLQRL